MWSATSSSISACRPHRIAGRRVAAPAGRAPARLGRGQHARERRRRAARRASPVARALSASAAGAGAAPSTRGSRGRACPARTGRQLRDAHAAAPEPGRHRGLPASTRSASCCRSMRPRDVAFVGGSLVPIGGHNLLEPAALGLPVLAGPQQLQFRGHRAAAGRLRRRAYRAGCRGPGRQSSANCWPTRRHARSMGARGRKAIEDNRGAVERLMEFIEPLLP